MKKGAVLFLAIMTCADIALGTDIWLDISTVVVTGTRIPEISAGRRVSVISKEEIKKSSAHSVPGLLKQAMDTDIQERSPYGIQSDVSIRGSSFQQALVLIDGMRVNDSQTAHHNMDLPLALNDIERVEVLPGHGSSTYGPDAFGGVVNIITKKPEKKELGIQAGAAGYNTRLFSVSAGNKWDIFSQRVSFEKKKSGGFRYDSDFDNFNFSSKSNWEYSKGETGLDLGYMEKEFGAYDFYTPGKNLPSKEWTRTYFTRIGSSYKLDEVTLRPKIFFRQHNDKFVLDITRPSYYVNEHVTYYYGGEVQAEIPVWDEGKLVAGAEAVCDQIESLRLGNHVQPRQALFGEFHKPVSSKIDMNAGIRFDDSGWGKQVSPTVSVSGRVSSSVKLRVSAGRAFRSPSFTELYYTDPVNKPNPLLKPEEAISCETGVDFTPSDEFNFFFTVFNRKQSNLIDWVGETSTGTWKPDNIGESSVYGFESAIKTNIYSYDISLQYSRVESKQEKVYISKYALNHPLNQASLCVSKQLFLGITPAIEILYKYRADDNKYTLLNGKIYKDFRNTRCYIDGTNLIDEKYEDIPGIPQPGMWVGAGIEWKL